MDRGRRVAINTVIGYVQMVLNIIIGFVSVRLILNALGQSDYGVYDLIAGVIGLLNFISYSLSQSSMRFISVSLGKGDPEETSKVVNACRWLHLAIALGLAIVLEIVGLFLFDGFLNIPDDRIAVAKIIYQCMILSLFIRVNSSPLTALIGSHEHFWYTALVSITDSLLKLLIAVIIVHTSHDKLLLYGVLMLGITVVNYGLYLLYNRIRFPNLIRRMRPDMEGIRRVTGFAGWTLLDTLSSIANRQGYAIMLNKFFGPVMNSAFAVSRQLEGHIFTISLTVVGAMKPQIMKSHGNGENERMFRLSMTSGKLGFCMMSLIAIPLIITMPEILQLWLKDVPENTVLFSRLLIIACMAEQLTRGLVHANQALGNIKWFSIVISSVRVMALPISILVLYLGAPAYASIVVFLICETLGSLSRVFILSKISSFRPKLFFKDVLFPILPPTIIAVAVGILCHRSVPGLWGVGLTFAVAIVCESAILYLFGLSKAEKETIKKLIPRKR